MKKNFFLNYNFYSLLIVFCLTLIGVSCTTEEGDFIKATAKNGPYIKFLNADNFPASSYEGAISSWNFSGEVEDPSNNVSSYQLFVGIGTETPVTTGITLSSFPSTLSITGAQVLSALGKSDTDFSGNIQIRFYGRVTGKDGVIAQDFPNNSNVSTDFINWNDGTFSA